MGTKLSRFESVGKSSNLWPQIAICGHRFKSVGTDCNLWPQIRICGNGLQSVGTDLNLWEQIAKYDCNTSHAVVNKLYGAYYGDTAYYGDKFSRSRNVKFQKFKFRELQGS